MYAYVACGCHQICPSPKSIVEDVASGFVGTKKSPIPGLGAHWRAGCPEEKNKPP